MPRHKIDMSFVKSVYAPGIDVHQMERYNRMKYSGKPAPSIDLILKVQKGTGLSQWDFELKYGISQNTIALVKGGFRPLPKAYWHIFYDFKKLKKIQKEAIEFMQSYIDSIKPKQINPVIFKKRCDGETLYKGDSEFKVPEENKKILDEYKRRKGE